MSIRTQSLVLVSLLASAGCAAVLPATPQLATGTASVLAAASRQVPTKRQIFTAWDTDQDGLLSLAEYETGFLSVLQPAPTPDQIPALKALIDAEFHKLDRNNNGQLTYSEFRKPNANQLGQVSPADLQDGNAFLEAPADPTPVTAA